MIDLYGVRRRHGGVWFEDLVAASSFEEAESLAEKMGGEVTGKLLAEYPASDADLGYGFREGGIWRHMPTVEDL